MINPVGGGLSVRLTLPGFDAIRCSHVGRESPLATRWYDAGYCYHEPL